MTCKQARCIQMNGTLDAIRLFWRYSGTCTFYCESSRAPVCIGHASFSDGTCFIVVDSCYQALERAHLIEEDTLRIGTMLLKTHRSLKFANRVAHCLSFMRWFGGLVRWFVVATLFTIRCEDGRSTESQIDSLGRLKQDFVLLCLSVCARVVGTGIRLTTENALRPWCWWSASLSWKFVVDGCKTEL
eukprot:3066532-Amphidinium_carterae.1